MHRTDHMPPLHFGARPPGPLMAGASEARTPWFAPASTPDRGSPVSRCISVLLVEDADEDALLVRHYLDRADGDFDFTRARTLGEVADRASSGDTWDVVLLDLGLPDSDGVDGVRRLKHLVPGTPVLVLSDSPPELAGVASVEHGAQDFLPKSEMRPATLGRAISFAMGRSQAGRQMERMALIDPLTGVYNRGFFDETLRRLCARREGVERVALLWIDLDRFKYVNDRWGHLIGDRLLLQVAQRLRTRVRASDLLCRLGGDEFGVLLEGVPNLRVATKVANDLQACLADPFDLGVTQHQQTASIGVAIFPSDEPSVETLIRAADAAMYSAKAAGRGEVRGHTDEDEQKLKERLELEDQLRGVIERDELSVVFQPICSIEGGGWTSVEALARWWSPQLDRWVSPVEFIPLAEENGMIRAIGAHVLRLALQGLATLRRRHPSLRVAVNLSPRELDGPTFVESVLEQLAAAQLPPDALILELTETALMADAGVGRSALVALRSAGVSVSIDDFGTGYSSLAYLRDLPVDYLKIDRSFVSGDDTEGSGSKIAGAIIALGASLDLLVVAEGVETPEQLARMRAAGCSHVQGYLLGRPKGCEKLLDPNSNPSRSVGDA